MHAVVCTHPLSGPGEGALHLRTLSPPRSLPSSSGPPGLVEPQEAGSPSLFAGGCGKLFSIPCSLFMLSVCEKVYVFLLQNRFIVRLWECEIHLNSHMEVARKPANVLSLLAQFSILNTCRGPGRMLSPMGREPRGRGLRELTAGPAW